jgi:ABC-type antimicrobial peptide transport system permease subunit
VAAGLLLGLAGAATSVRLLQSMMYGARPENPMLAAAACGAMVITSVAAAYVPAMRAASVDPMQALRSE